MNKWILLSTIGLATTLALSACGKSQSDGLAKSQACLDKVSESRPDDALKCLDPIASYNSQQADILKCSIYITSGGLMESKIAKGYNILKDSTQTNKAASFMAVLSLSNPNVNEGYNRAVTASTYCNASGVAGLKYLSGIVVTGSYMAKTLANLPIPSNIDPSDPASVNTAVQSLLTQCTGASPPASCTADLPQLGSTVVSLSSSYCSTSGADQTVCGQITNAVNSSGGADAAVGQALLCYMNHQTYSPTDGLCH